MKKRALSVFFNISDLWAVPADNLSGFIDDFKDSYPNFSYYFKKQMLD